MAKDKDTVELFGELYTPAIRYEQEKYGVPYVQPAYGVPTAQPAYGVIPIVEPTPVVQPAYGVPVTGPLTDINITYDQLEDMITTLRKATSTLKDSWTRETSKNLSTLENSWVGNDCRAYTNRVRKMDGKVQNTIEALDLLASTYEKARDMVQENQKNTMAAIQRNE